MTQSAPVLTATEVADTVLRGGPVLTMDDWKPGQRTAEVLAAAPRAVAIRGGRVIALGEQAAAELIGEDTTIVELDGRVVLPGIGDAHLHFTAYSLATNGHVKLGPSVLRDWRDLAGCLSPGAVSADGWLRGHGWSELVLGRVGTRHDIDAALAAHGLHDVPAVLFDWSGHTLVANTEALRRAGITALTESELPGVIGREEDGTPNGFLGDGAMALMNAAMPPVPREALRAAYLRAQAQLHEMGITAITEPGLGPGAAALLDGSCTVDALELLGDLAETEELTLRTNVLVLFAGTGGASAALYRAGIASGLADRYRARGIDPARLRIGGAKIFADGVPMNHTSWFHEPYGEEQTRGRMVVAGDDDESRVAELREIVRVLNEAGLQAGIHAIGDAAADAAVDAISWAHIASGNRGLRHYLIHASVLSDQSIRTMGEEGIGLATNPVITRLGREADGGAPAPHKLRHEMVRTLHSHGVRTCLMTDAPIVSPDWRHNIIHAVKRTQLYVKRPENDTENISGIDALATVTIAPAAQEHADSMRGSLAVGKLADLVVLGEGWPADDDIEDLADIPTDLTMVGGRVVYLRGR